MKFTDMKQKMRIYCGLILFLMGILVFRLVFVQLFKNEVYQTQAKENSIRLIPIKASRGEIFTRDNQVLATNKLVYTVSLTNLEMGKDQNMIHNLSQALSTYYPEVTKEFIYEKINSQMFRLYEPITLVRDAPWELVVELEENRQQFPGIMINIEPLRSYPLGSLAGHVLGYIHQISTQEMENMEKNNIKYSMDSLIGKSGVEKQYEQILRGQDGARRLEVDAKGRPIRELVTQQPTAGDHVYLTIDSTLQQVMEQSMETTLRMLQAKSPKAKVGSAVLMNVKTGEVLAMCSSPGLNPDDWKGNISSEKVAYYFPQTPAYDPMQPGAQTNRAISATYPPGSTFKPITGMAALAAGVMDPLQDYVNCPGAYWIKPNIRCTGVHGNVNYISGMAHSCNTYFQEMGRRTTKDGLIDIGEQFGLGSKTGIDLPDERTGLLPTPEWKKEINTILLDRQNENNLQALEEKYNNLLAQAQSEEEINSLIKKKNAEKATIEARYGIDFNFNTNWQQFDTFNMSIGQGYNDFTVIQLANYISTLANGGQLMKPHVVDRIMDANGNIIMQNKPEVVRTIDQAAQIIPWTKRAMAAVTEPGGTAYSLFAKFPSHIKVGAKTGTAETGRTGDNSLKETHGVFVAFAPVDDPVVAFAGVIEYGTSGSGSAGLVCKTVFEQYFGLVDHLHAPVVETPSTAGSNQVPAAPVDELPIQPEVIEDNPGAENPDQPGEDTEAPDEPEEYEPKIIIPNEEDLNNIR